mgnify:FL=1|tara:strand:+ start:33519 stop:34466 length:948 start_codon:yes stop_codon:yes gene_type:complete
MLKRVVLLIVGLVALALIPMLIFAYTQLKPVLPQDVKLNFDDAASLAFFVMGDQGTGNLRQWQVADAMEQQADHDPVQGVLLLGDNFYRYGVASVTDWQWRYKFEHAYKGSLSAVPFFATLGNHDYYGNELAQINYDLKDLGSRRWQMPARDYIRVFGQGPDQALLRVAFIDSGFWLRSPVDASQTLDRLLEAAEPARWTVVVTHTPLLSGNTLDIQAEAQGLWQPILQSHGVDIVLSGHDHNMQYLQQAGWPDQAIIGVGGKSGQPLDFEDAPGLEFYSDFLGFGRLGVSADRLSLQFYDSEGNLLTERLIIAG